MLARVNLDNAVPPHGQRPRFRANGTPPVSDAVAPGPPTSRTAVPADVLLAETIAWYEAMPTDIQPRTLIATYPRIANALCAAASDPRLFDDYMGALLIDGRGQRAGFPAGVLRDLLALRAHVHALHADGFGTSQIPTQR
jgi:hypothetical protein